MATFDPIVECEYAVSQCMHSNTVRGELLSENLVGERLLGHRQQLADAYYELVLAFRSEKDLRTFFGLVLSAAAPWTAALPPHVAAEQAELIQLNRRIADSAQMLAGMLDRREDLRATTFFADNTFFSSADVLSLAFRETLNQNGAAEGVDALRQQFDWRYWPTMADVCRELERDAEEAYVPADQSADIAEQQPAVERARHFFHTLLNAMHIGNGHAEMPPPETKISDGTLAALANAALGLSPDQRLLASDVKGLRPWIYPWEAEPDG